MKYLDAKYTILKGTPELIMARALSSDTPHAEVIRRLCDTGLTPHQASAIWRYWLRRELLNSAECSNTPPIQFTLSGL